METSSTTMSTCHTNAVCPYMYHVWGPMHACRAVRAIILIQKMYRGWLARKRFRALVFTSLDNARMAYYHRHATTIQKMWRGYYTRKYIHNYYARKAYLHGLTLKNDHARRQIEVEAAQIKERRDAIEQRQKDASTLRMLRTQHFQLSTQVVDGVNANVLMEPDKEGSPRKEEVVRRTMKLLPSIPVHAPREDPPILYTTPAKQPTYYAKPQGPFKSPDQVLRFRTQPSHPTLRAMADVESERKAMLEDKKREWVGRVVDKPFIPSSTTFAVPHPASLNATAPFIGLGPGDRRMDYGTKTFRDELPSKAFKSPVKGIPVFDEYGRQ